MAALFDRPRISLPLSL